MHTFSREWTEEQAERPAVYYMDDDAPRWIPDAAELTVYDLDAIRYGGCASGAYMPAVTYYQARHIMAEHGDDVLEYLEDSLGELPPPPSDISWSGLACHYLSAAVELWAWSLPEDLDPSDFDDDTADDTAEE